MVTHDGRVVQGPRSLGLAQEALPELGLPLGRQAIRQEIGLDSQIPPDPRVVGQIDHSHGAPADLALHLVSPDPSHLANIWS